MNVKVCLGAAGLAAGLFVNTAAAQIISQAPNGVNGFFSDNAYPQSIADDFVVSSGGASLGLLTFYGGYFPNNLIVPDSFGIRIHGDAGGLPDGTAAYLNLSGVTADSRTDTGTDLFGVDEYVYTYDLGGLNLGAGVYWLEIFNNKGSNGDFWFWETGDLDVLNGRLNAAFAQQVPGTSWLLNAGSEQAFTIDAVPAPASLALLGLAGLGVRRRR